MTRLLIHHVEADGVEDLFVLYTGDACHEFDTDQSVDPESLTVNVRLVPCSVVRACKLSDILALVFGKIRSVEPLKGHVKTDLSEDTELECYNGVVDADSGKHLDVQVKPELCKVLVRKIE